MLLFLKISRPAVGPTQMPIQWVPGFLPENKAVREWRWPLASI